MCADLSRNNIWFVRKFDVRRIVLAKALRSSPSGLLSNQRMPRTHTRSQRVLHVLFFFRASADGSGDETFPLLKRFRFGHHFSKANSKGKLLRDNRVRHVDSSKAIPDRDQNLDSLNGDSWHLHRSSDDPKHRRHPHHQITRCCARTAQLSRAGRSLPRACCSTTRDSAQKL